MGVIRAQRLVDGCLDRDAGLGDRVHVCGVADDHGREHAAHVVGLAEFVPVGRLEAGTQLVESAQIVHRL